MGIYIFLCHHTIFTLLFDEVCRFLVSGTAIILDASFEHQSIGYFNYGFITLVSISLFLLYFVYATKIIIVRNEHRSKKLKSKMEKSKLTNSLTSRFKEFVSTKE